MSCRFPTAQPSIGAKERPVPEVRSLVGFIYDLKLVISASSNYHALSLSHSKLHCPRSCFAVVFEPLPHNCYRLDSGATVLLKPARARKEGVIDPFVIHYSSNGRHRQMVIRAIAASCVARF
jgi:hypothetical protein